MATAPELLPGFASWAGRLLPAGAGATALRDSAHFGRHAIGFPLIVLGAWAVFGLGMVALAGHRAPKTAPRLIATNTGRATADDSGATAASAVTSTLSLGSETVETAETAGLIGATSNGQVREITQTLPTGATDHHHDHQRSRSRRRRRIRLTPPSAAAVRRGEAAPAGTRQIASPRPSRGISVRVMVNPQTPEPGGRATAIGDDDFAELLPETRRALAHRLAVAQRDGRLPGVVAVVLRDGERRWWGSRSMVDGHAPDRHTQFRIGSITKTFVAVLVMRLRDEGQLRLSDRIGQHLPALGPAVGEVTIRQLLSHTSGLTNEPPGPWWERTEGALRPELADLLQHPPLRHEPGRLFHYSNVGYALLGALVEHLRGDDWFTVLHREVLRPLGMRRTTALPDAPHAGGWAVHPWADVIMSEPLQRTGRMAPAGELWSTADDLTRWAAFLAAGDGRVLAAGSVAEMRECQTDGEERYGLGLALRQAGDLSLAGHTGSLPGFLAMLWTVPEAGLGVVVLANATASPGAAFGELGADLLRIVSEREPRMPEPWRPLTSYDPEVLALTGPWYWGPAGYGLRLVGEDELELTPLTGTGNREARLHRADDGETWIAEGGYWHGEPMHVVRDANGQVTHLDLGTFVLTREPYPLDGPVPGGVDPAGWRAEKW